jgi:hypothetical protein
MHRSLLAKALEDLPGGIDFILVRPKDTVASIISKKESDKFVYSGKPVLNPKLVGVWPIAGHIEIDPKNPEEAAKAWYQGLKKPLKQTEAQYGVEFKADGSVSVLGYLGRTYDSKYRWTDGYMFGVYSDDALKMKPLTIDGRDFILLEKPFLSVGNVAAAGGGEESGSGDTGDTGPEIKPGWHPGYTLLIRESSDFVSMKSDKKKGKK